MSYILDALRKAERDRPRGTARVPAPPSAPASRASRYWPWALGGAIAVNAAILIWMAWPGADLRPEPRAAATTSSAPTVTAPPLAATPVAPPRVADAPAAVTSQTLSPPGRGQGEGRSADPTRRAVESAPNTARASDAVARATNPHPGPLPERESETSRKPLPPAATAPRTAVTKDVPATRAAVPAAAVAPGVRAPAAPVPAPAATAREPAPAVDAQLQRLRLQFVAYSDVAADRFVFIDNQKLVEGQAIDNGVVIERIDPASVVLKHPGGRFVLRADPSAGR